MNTFHRVYLLFYRQMSLTFRQQLLSVFQVKTDSRVSLEVSKATYNTIQIIALALQISKLNDADESVTTVLGRCLPYIVPNVILAKREVNMAFFLVILIVCFNFVAYIHVWVSYL